MKLVFLGAPGSGKGTQSELISKRLNIPGISTGNILREAIKNEDENGKLAKKYVEAGELVPDEVMVNIIKTRIAGPDCKNGFILDGFPRTVAQAEALDNMGVTLDTAISFEIADEVIEKRMTGRRVCSSCGAPYHIEHKKPSEEGVCDLCSGPLVQRSDDIPETVRNRLITYHEMTEPVKGYYERQGKLKIAVAHDSIEAISARVYDLLGINDDTN